MFVSEKGGRGAMHLGRSAFVDGELEKAMWRVLGLGGGQPACSVSIPNSHGGRAHLLSAGEGPTIILLHGAGGGAANWYQLIPKLAERYRVIAVDLPGFGLSDAIEPEKPLGRQVAAWIDETLGDDAGWPHIIGTSFGGLTAFRLAQIHKPKSLILIDSAGLWPECALGLRLACNRFIQSLPVKQTRAGTRWLLRNVLLSSRIDPEHEAALADYLYWSNLRTDRKAIARAYSQFAGLRGQYEVFTNEELEQLADRTMIIWGERDRFLPALQKRRDHALAAGAQLRIIPNVGHSPNWEAPELLLKEILNFIER